MFSNRFLDTAGDRGNVNKARVQVQTPFKPQNPSRCYFSDCAGSMLVEAFEHLVGKIRGGEKRKTIKV